MIREELLVFKKLFERFHTEEVCNNHWDVEDQVIQIIVHGFESALDCHKELAVETDRPYPLDERYFGGHSCSWHGKFEELVKINEFEWGCPICKGPVRTRENYEAFRRYLKAVAKTILEERNVHMGLNTISDCLLFHHADMSQFKTYGEWYDYIKNISSTTATIV